MGILLSIVASILKWILHPIAYSLGTIVSIYKGENNEWNRDLALSKDRMGNVLCKYLFNFLLITKEGYKFGNGKETISSVVGKNKRDKTLSVIGKVLDYLLDEAETGHSIKSIDETVS